MIHQQIFIEACREPFSGIVKVSSSLVIVHHESIAHVHNMQTTTNAKTPWPHSEAYHLLHGFFQF